MIKLKELTYIYGLGTPQVKTALDDISIEIPAGSFVGLIGHTGSGKTTLIQHLNGLLKPSAGQVLIDNVDIWRDKETTLATRFKVGLVFQYPEHQLFEETVYKDIAFGPKNMGLSDKEIDDRIEDALHFVGLSPAILEKSPFELSGGQKRRVAIAGVMAMVPSVLILDEPTAGLDPRGRENILGRVREYHQEKGSTVILVSHSMEDIAKNARHVLVMNDGKIAKYGEVGEVFSHAEELTAMGLAVPQVTRIFHSLIQMGHAVPDRIYTVEQGRCALLDRLGKGGASTC